jgi:hypothetical protein
MAVLETDPVTGFDTVINQFGSDSSLTLPQRQDLESVSHASAGSKGDEICDGISSG